MNFWPVDVRMTWWKHVWHVAKEPVSEPYLLGSWQEWGDSGEFNEGSTEKSMARLREPIKE